MARTNERLALILEYVVEGRGDIDALSDELQTLDSQTEKLKKGGFDMMNFKKHKKNVNSFKSSVQNLNKTTAQTAGSTRASNFALMNFNRIIQDAPFGIMGIANNIPIMVESFQSLTQEVGPSGQKKGATGAIKSMISAIASPGGLLMVLGSAIPTLLLFADKFGWFESKAKASKEELEQMNEAIKEQIDMSFEGLNAEQEIKAVEQALLTLDPPAKEVENTLGEWEDDLKKGKFEFESISEEMEFQRVTGKETVNTMKDLGVIAQIRHKNAIMSGERQREAYENSMKELRERGKINEKIEEELKNRLAQLEVDKMVAEQVRKLNLSEEKRKQSLKEANRELREAKRLEMERYKARAMQDEIIQPEIDTELDSDPFAEEDKAKKQALAGFEDRMLKERIRIAQMSGNKINAIEMQRKQELNSLLDLELADYEKAQKLKARINERYNKQIKNIEEEQTKQRIGMYAQMAQGISSIITNLFGESKGAQIAGAIINTLAGITQALSAYPPPLSFIQAGAVASQGFATVKQIKNTDMNSKSTGGGRGYRTGGKNAQFSSGASNLSPALSASRNRGVDGSTVRLEDDAGNFLTRLQFAQDKDGGDNYLIDKNSNG